MAALVFTENWMLYTLLLIQEPTRTSTRAVRTAETDANIGPILERRGAFIDGAVEAGTVAAEAAEVLIEALATGLDVLEKATIIDPFVSGIADTVVGVGVVGVTLDVGVLSGNVARVFAGRVTHIWVIIGKFLAAVLVITARTRACT